MPEGDQIYSEKMAESKQDYYLALSLTLKWQWLFLSGYLICLKHYNIYDFFFLPFDLALTIKTVQIID
jgi:hypothetical protein